MVTFYVNMLFDSPLLVPCVHINIVPDLENSESKLRTHTLLDSQTHTHTLTAHMAL